MPFLSFFNETIIKLLLKKKNKNKQTSALGKVFTSNLLLISDYHQFPSKTETNVLPVKEII